MVSGVENNQYTICNRNRREFHVSQTEDCGPEDSLAGCSEDLLRRNSVASTVLCLVWTKNIKQVRDTFLHGWKK